MFWTPAFTNPHTSLTRPCSMLPPHSELIPQAKNMGAALNSCMFRGRTTRLLVEGRVEQQPGVLFGRFGGGDGGIGNLIQERCFWYRPKEVEVICEWCGVVTLCR